MPAEPPPQLAPLAELAQITKAYPNGVVALRGVDLALRTGEVHALVGENGAGKSTLVKVLFGLEAASSGEVRLLGKPVSGHSPATAIAAGIGMVHQHFKLVPSLTAAENLVLGAEPLRRGCFDRAGARRAAVVLADRLGVRIDPDARAANLPVGDQQRLEIMKALHRGANVLILDEPTSVLTPQEADRLLTSVRALADNGTGVVFITHKLREVMAVADMVTVLRDGLRVTTIPRADATVDGLARAMVGRDVVPPGRDAVAATGPVRLRLTGVSTGGSGRGRLQRVDLEVRAGEIVGVAGVEGNGQDDLVDVVTGLRPPAAGSVELDDRDVTRWTVGRRRRRGLAHIAADRVRRGVALDASLAANITAARVAGQYSRHGVLDRTAIHQAGRTAMTQFEIRAADPSTPVSSLSGGNLQKVVVARELSGDPGVVVAAHPTRGVDLGAMALIHEALLARRSAGGAVLLVSSELDELRRLSDRIVVLSDGSLVATFDDPTGTADETLGRAMAGAVG